MDFRHLIVTCLFSKLRLPFDNQKVKENYAIFFENIYIFCQPIERKPRFMVNKHITTNYLYRSIFIFSNMVPIFTVKFFSVFLQR